jgi:gliding motility-associated-like protein
MFSQFLLFSQTDCDNLNFEEGNLQSWTKGGNVQLVNRQQVDYYGNFPLALSGGFSVMLGNKQTPVITSPYLSSIKRTITINESNKNLIYGYAIVLLGYPHTSEEASFVKLDIRNQMGQLVPCTEYSVFAQSEVGNGFYKSIRDDEQNISGQCCFSIYYQPWKMNAIDLSPYIGQTLTISITSDWCVFDVDWGYAYVDFYCYDDIFVQYLDCNTNSFRIETAEGFNDYNWSGPEILTGQGTNSITTNQDGTYLLAVSNSDNNCPDVQLSYDFYQQNSPPNFLTQFDYLKPACENETVYFSNSSSSFPEIINYTWDFGDGTESFEFSPSHLYLNNGVYNVTLIVENEVACFDTLVKPVVIDSIVKLSIGLDLVHCDDEWLTIQIVNTGELTNFQWSTGENGVSIQTQESGEFFVIAKDGCAVSDTINVTEDPAFFGRIPNVFTPNSDAINNFYFIESQDVVMFKLEIVNRWGELVYATDNPEFQWNGNMSELPLKDGVYFYKLIYQLNCQDSPRNKNGFVTIVK